MVYSPYQQTLIPEISQQETALPRLEYFSQLALAAILVANSRKV